MLTKETDETRRRIVESAAHLFAKRGYNGTSTRDIAFAARINHATLFRHFSHKADLYTAVVQFNCDRFTLQRNLLAKLADATDGQTALAVAFELFTATFLEQRSFLRLLQFRSLEPKREVDLLLRAHLDRLIDLVAGHLQPWVDKGQIRISSARAAAVTLFAATFGCQSLSKLLEEDFLSTPGTIEVHAEISGVVAAS